MLTNMQVFTISLLLFIMFRREVKPQPIDTPSPTLHFVCNGFFFQPFWTVYFFFFFNDHKRSNGPLSIYQNSKMAPRLGGIKQNIFHLLILTLGIPTNLLCNTITWWAISTKWTLGVTVCYYDQKCNMIVNDSTRYLL